MDNSDSKQAEKPHLSAQNKQHHQPQPEEDSSLWMAASRWQHSNFPSSCIQALHFGRAPAVSSHICVPLCSTRSCGSGTPPGDCHQPRSICRQHGWNYSHPLQMGPSMQSPQITERRDEDAGHTCGHEISPNTKPTPALHNCILTQLFLSLAGSFQIQGCPLLSPPRSDTSQPPPKSCPVTLSQCCIQWASDAIFFFFFCDNDDF